MSDGDTPSGPAPAPAPATRTLSVVAGASVKVGAAPPAMLLGFNYAWAYNKYGLYFGPFWPNPVLPPQPPSDPAEPLTQKDRFGNDLQEDPMATGWLPSFSRNVSYLRRQLQISVVRVFLLCNGQNWGGVDASGAFKPPPYLHPRFRYHFRGMLKACADVGMQLIPSLIDFGIGKPGQKDRRLPIVTDSQVQTLFYDQVLEPLLLESTNYRSTIYAWEVMNEPSWLTAHYFANEWRWYVPWDYLPSSPLASEGQLTSFLNAGIQRIERSGFRSTVGHRYFSDLKKFPTGNTPQFHYYPSSSPVNDDPSTLPDMTGAAAPVPILGEFGILPEQGGLWSELGGRDGGRTDDRVAARLQAANAKHYTLAIVWPDYPDPGDSEVDPLKLSSAAEQGIRTFLASR